MIRFLESCVAVLLVFHCFAIGALTAEPIKYETLKDIPYRNTIRKASYASQQCQLDIYYPANIKQFPTVIWFHGGGLKNGSRSFPTGLINKRLAIVAVGYRLSPKAQVSAILDDAAAAVAWTFQNIEQYGGSRKLIFVSGHSAGGYLTSMIGLNGTLLGAHNIDSNSIAGLIPYSGHAITHFTARAELGISDKQPIIDKFAPLYHVKKDCPPLFLITGDRDLELLGRYEENAYFWRMMKVAGNTKTYLREIKGHNHGQMAKPAHALLIEFIKTRVTEIQGVAE